MAFSVVWPLGTSREAGLAGNRALEPSMSRPSHQSRHQLTNNPRTWLEAIWTASLPGVRGRPWLEWRLWRGVDHRYPRGPENPLGADNPYGFDAPSELWDFFSAPASMCPCTAATSPCRAAICRLLPAAVDED